MKKRRLISGYLGIILLTAAGGLAYAQEELSLRRVRNISSRAEYILNPELAAPLSAELVIIAASRIPEIDGLLKDVGYEFSLNTWRIGLVIAILKDIQGLGLETLDLANWIEENFSSLSEYFPYLEMPVSSRAFEKLRNTVKTVASRQYKRIQDDLINYYFLEFMQRAQPSLTLFDPSRTEESQHDLALKGILNLHLRRNQHPQAGSFIPSNYLPDLERLGGMKSSNPLMYHEEVEGYLLHKLIRFELTGYANHWLREKKYSPNIQEIKNNIFMVDVQGKYIMKIESVRQELRQYYAYASTPPAVLERLLATADERFLRNLLLEAKTSQLIQEDINRFGEENFYPLKRIVWSALNLKPYFENNSLLVDLLGISEAEHLVRKVISLYFNNLVVESGYSQDYDPHLYANKNKNRTASEDWANVAKKIEEIRQSFGSSSDNNRANKTISYYLIKKLATAGVYDLSIKEIQDRFGSAGGLTGLEESESLREYRFELSAFNKLFNEVLANKDQKTKLIVTADNHGEIVYLLGFIQFLLQEVNPNLTVYLIPRRTPVADDAYYSAVREILKDDKTQRGHFNFLNSSEISDKRFIIVRDGPDIQGEDFRNVSQEEFRALTSLQEGQKQFEKIVYLGIGNANFVSTQGLNLERYYLYRVKIDRVAQATGISKDGFPLILAYVGPGVSIGASFAIDRYTNLVQYLKLHPEFFDPPRGSYGK